jgi:type III secretion system FlhB-like substrate exporter
LIDDETDMVKFKWDAVALEMDSTKEDDKAPKMIADGPGRKIKAVDNGKFMKIYKNSTSSLL